MTPSTISHPRGQNKGLVQRSQVKNKKIIGLDDQPPCAIVWRRTLEDQDGRNREFVVAPQAGSCSKEEGLPSLPT
eukprot:7029170-Prorocentrum_lima.AAC.1